MDTILIFKICCLLSLGVFALPRKAKYTFVLALQILFIGITSAWAFEAFRMGNLDLNLGISFWSGDPRLGVDKLTAFFILLVNFICLMGFTFARGYLAPYIKTKSNSSLSLHYFSFLWLQLAMLLVVMAREGMFFLVVWELMSLFSFLLVIFDAEERMNMKAGINYLIQMHIAFFFLLLAFVGLAHKTGNANFESFRIYFANSNNMVLFALFFVGFGLKAGFVPLHTWLPQAHPAAPSHVSGVMSGVMIKIGIYGIIRVLMNIQSDQFYIGCFILMLSVISGVYAITTAIVQNDIKKLLAYSSIENVSIIGIGIGVGTIGMSANNSVLATLGFGGALLHTLNHSIIKSLLFFTAGKVISACHTRNIDLLGGIIKKMPVTSALFLVGSLSICALPPFNGFISEFVIFSGIIKGVQEPNIVSNIVFISSLLGLACIGGLSIFAFTKLFGIAFLGEARSEMPAHAHEPSKKSLLPIFILACLVVIIGLVPLVFIKPVMGIVEAAFRIETVNSLSIPMLVSISNIGIAGGSVAILVMVLYAVRSLKLQNSKVVYGPTWGCGYTAGNSKHQYTSASYADYFAVLTGNMVNIHKKMKPIGETEIFPNQHSFSTYSEDPLKMIDDIPVRFTERLLRRSAVIQTGQIQHYILYALLFMVIILVVSLLGFI